MILIGLAGLILLHAAAVVCFGTRWWITSGEVVQSRGVVSRHTEDLWLADLSRGEVKQDFVERLLGVGSISVATLPEPSAWLLVLGACLLDLRGRRQSRLACAIRFPGQPVLSPVAPYPETR